MADIFLVEDDPKLRSELKILLEKHGHRCLLTTDFSGVVEQVLQAGPHLVLLDLNLPAYDGTYLCREIRRRSQVPIIIVTSRDSETDELLSMNLGADDFITKPYNTQILLARIASVLKRACPGEPSRLLSHRGVCLDLGTAMVEHEGAQAELSKNELRILATLMGTPGQIVSRNKLMDALWQSDEFVDDNTLTVNINRLRKKLDGIGVSGFLATRRGQGYLV